jgi:MFS family permease
VINLNKKLFSITFASGVQGALQGIFMAYLGLHANYLGASALIIGLIFFSRNFFQIFLRVPFGELSQITGRRPLILLGCGFFVFSYFLMYAAETWRLIFGSTILFAIGMAFYYPSLFSYIGDIATDNYGKVNGIVFQGSDIGLILSALITNYSLRNDLVDLKNLFGYGFLIGILCLIVMFIILKESIDEVNRKVVTNKLNHW